MAYVKTICLCYVTGRATVFSRSRLVPRNVEVLGRLKTVGEKQTKGSQRKPCEGKTCIASYRRQRAVSDYRLVVQSDASSAPTTRLKNSVSAESERIRCQASRKVVRHDKQRRESAQRRSSSLGFCPVGKLVGYLLGSFGQFAGRHVLTATASRGPKGECAEEWKLDLAMTLLRYLHSELGDEIGGVEGGMVTSYELSKSTNLTIHNGANNLVVDAV
jgi:hypothetical protein